MATISEKLQTLRVLIWGDKDKVDLKDLELFARDFLRLPHARFEVDVMSAPVKHDDNEAFRQVQDVWDGRLGACSRCSMVVVPPEYWRVGKFLERRVSAAYKGQKPCVQCYQQNDGTMKFWVL